MQANYDRTYITSFETLINLMESNTLHMRTEPLEKMCAKFEWLYQQLAWGHSYAHRPS